MANPFSRPLKTGQKFMLVIPDVRVTQLRFDKADYSPGDPCTLTIDGRNLGSTPLDLLVEEEQDGVWMQVATASAEVGADEAKATASWSFPVPPTYAAEQAALRGKLTTAQWADPSVSEGDKHVVQVATDGLEGEDLVVLIEQQMPDGTWRFLQHASPTVQDGKAEVEFQTPAPPEPPAGNFTSAVFADGADLGEADTAWLNIAMTGLDKQQVQIVMEQQDDDGNWTEVSTAVSTVKDNTVRTGVPLDVE